jgi:hypothetical protein
MPKYRKKPVVIEAIQWDGENLGEVTKFTSGKLPELTNRIDFEKWDDYKRIVEEEGLKIKTLEGTMRADKGDYIIRGVQGEIYPCKPDIFDATYEAVISNER